MTWILSARPSYASSKPAVGRKVGDEQRQVQAEAARRVSDAPRKYRCARIQRISSCQLTWRMCCGQRFLCMRTETGLGLGLGFHEIRGVDAVQTTSQLSRMFKWTTWLFGSTHLCEKLFSTMMHLQATLRVSTASFLKPHVAQLCEKKRCQFWPQGVDVKKL